jgi:hypothetical protein
MPKADCSFSDSACPPRESNRGGGQEETEKTKKSLPR